MPRNHDFNEREIPFSQMRSQRLSEREESDDGLAAEVGLRPQRRLMVGADFYAQALRDPRSIHFRH